MLGNGVGDTPFGAYRFTGTKGGTSTFKISTGFGTGKINMDRVFGEVVDANRDLIRLHGGGTPLLRRKPPQDPYAPYQDLTPTQGCVRMHNAEVNSLIQAIQGLPKDDPLEFIFVGDSQYLNSMATNPTQAQSAWQRVLRVNLGLP